MPEFGTELILLMIILFVSSLTRSTFGFGDALIAMPLAVMVVSIRIATPLVALIACLIASLILIRNYKSIDFRSILYLILFSILGIPIGILYLKGSADFVIKLVLAILIISFALYKLFKPGLFKLRTNKSAAIFGLLGGMLGGAYNTNGPPIIIFGTMRGWPPNDFRAILQGVFLPTNIFIAAGHGIAGLWTTEMLYYFLFSLPVVGLAMWLGSRLNKMIPAEKFLKYIYIFLIVIGTVLIVKTCMETT